MLGESALAQQEEGKKASLLTIRVRTILKRGEPRSDEGSRNNERKRKNRRGSGLFSTEPK